MRYTRYEYKKSGKLRFLVTILIVAIISIAGGLYVSNFIFKGKEIPTGKKPQTVENNTQNQSVQSIKIMAIQCGYYTKKENADSEIAKLSPYCKPFIFEENNTYRIIAGIYNEENGMKKLEQFKSNGIEVAKVSLNLNDETEEDKKILEIIDGFLKITDKFDEQDVQSIKTEEFKTWANSIINADGNSNNKIEKLDNYIKQLPEDLDKNNISQNVQELYTIIRSYSSDKLLQQN